MILNQSILSVMLISSSIATSYGHKILHQSLPFPDHDDSSSALLGTDWQLSHINGAPAIRDEHEDPLGLSFSSEFELTGFDGCNQFSAQWSTVPSSSMIEVNMGQRTRRFCGWMTEEQDIQTRRFMGVLLGQDTIAYSLSEDGQELTLYTDDTPTMTMARIADDVEESDEQMEEQPEMTALAFAAAAGEYVSVGPTNEWLACYLDRCRSSFERCIKRGGDRCSLRFDSCIDTCINEEDNNLNTL